MKTKAKTMSVIDPGSFRDPSGFVFWANGQVYRQVNTRYKDDYDLLMRSGLFSKLLSQGLVIPHDEIDLENAPSSDAYKVLKPKFIHFISYPYEWCFGQLKDAALATLEIQRLALESSMSLKDSSAYNIQFVAGQSTLVDTLSFERYREGEPWIAYRQFCQHFLAPLALMSLVDERLGQLSRVFLDGIPLDVAVSALQRRGVFNVGLWLHLRLHALAQRRYADANIATLTAKKRVSKHALFALIDSLRNCIDGLKRNRPSFEWGRYYIDGKLDSGYVGEKKEIVLDYLETAKPTSVWDLGANTGLFSRIAAERGIPTVSFDSDIDCVERSYQVQKQERLKTLSILYMDLTNPSPASGWDHAERRSLVERGPTDLVFALAIVHHLAISNNLPFPRIASFFQRICTWLIVEFVPKDDEMVKKLLNSRKDVSWSYSKADFEAAFSGSFTIISSQSIGASSRTLYLMKAKGCE
jgi:hypothetical protein